MISYHQHRLHVCQIHANALGGFLGEPFHREADPAAPSSLPAAGGFATTRAEAFNFHNAVAHSSANTRVRGRPSGRQAARLIDRYEAQNKKDTYPWVLHLHGWMSTEPRTSGGGGSDRRNAAPQKTSGQGKKTPGKKPQTSGGGAGLDRLKPAPPKSSGPGKKTPGKKPRTSGGGAGLDR